MPADVTSLIRARPDAFRAATRYHFLSQHPEASELFPAVPRPGRPTVTDMAAWLTDQPPAAIRDRMEVLGRQSRRLGVPLEAYPTFAKSLIAGLDAALLGSQGAHPSAIRETCWTFAEAVRTAEAAARAADESGEPSAFYGEVSRVEQATDRMARIRVSMAEPVAFRPGQHMLVAPAQGSTAVTDWVPLAPWADPTGRTLTFDIADAACPLAQARAGDHWILGAPTGSLSISGTRKTILIARPHGWAALRSLLLDVEQRSQQPSVTLVVSAAEPAEHIDADWLWRMAATSSWLTAVLAVDRHGGRERAARLAGIPFIVSHDLVDLALPRGVTCGEEIVLAGTSGEIARDRARLDQIIAETAAPKSGSLGWEDRATVQVEDFSDSFATSRW